MSLLRSAGPGKAVQARFPGPGLVQQGGGRRGRMSHRPDLNPRDRGDLCKFPSAPGHRKATKYALCPREGQKEPESWHLESPEGWEGSKSSRCLSPDQGQAAGLAPEGARVDRGLAAPQCPLPGPGYGARTLPGG